MVGGFGQLVRGLRTSSVAQQLGAPATYKVRWHTPQYGAVHLECSSPWSLAPSGRRLVNLSHDLRLASCFVPTIIHVSFRDALGIVSGFAG